MSSPNCYLSVKRKEFFKIHWVALVICMHTCEIQLISQWQTLKIWTLSTAHDLWLCYSEIFKYAVKANTLPHHTFFQSFEKHLIDFISYLEKKKTNSLLLFMKQYISLHIKFYLHVFITFRKLKWQTATKTMFTFTICTHIFHLPQLTPPVIKAIW